MSDEVSSFLRDVEQLKGRRTEEDEARSRELEEKILLERRERQARREERARSISPQKSSPAHTPPPPSHRNHAYRLSDGLPTDQPPRFPSLESNDQQNQDQCLPIQEPDAMPVDYHSSSPTKENDFHLDPESKLSGTTTSAGASRALSWQRRPPSQSSERPKSRNRPLSVVAAENAAVRSSSDVPDQGDVTPSRDQIAQSLGSKDPSWFRQTADRGQTSAAYRRTQVEDDSARTDMSAFKMEMHDMSRTPSSELDRPADRRPSSHSPFALGPSQRLDPPGMDSSGDKEPWPQDRQSLTSPPLGGRMSPTRPLSPTKGMGGFVQSAMMKRTDSVKRWSVSSPQGLQRADTVTSNRNSISDINRTATLSHSRSNSAFRAESISRSSSRPSSRPTSSHGIHTTAETASAIDEDASEDRKADEDEQRMPISPSKTMDPRRWSPSKSSSWLEAALNKPDSPKPKPATPAASQPAWMVELNKTKAHKANNPSVDMGRNSAVTHKHEVRVGGLMRAPPMGTGVKPTPLPGGMHSPSLSVGGENSPVPSLRNRFSNPTMNFDDGREQAGDTPQRKVKSPVLPKQKPDTPPKKDFRASLKPFQPPSASSVGGSTNELKNVFGTLRKTKTQNYVAPDPLKDNILRGKDALNVTGGPKPSVRKDEFKDAILQKKADFQKAQAEGRGVTRSAGEPTDKPLPEGLAKKLELGRSKTVSASSDSTTTRTEPFRSSSASTTVKQAPAVSPKPPTTNTLPKVAGGRLADRFNPALAGLLARGPPGSGAVPGKSADASSAPGTGTEEPSGPGPQLTHMTKGRARGPRRKAPTTFATSATTTTSSTSYAPKSATSPSFEAKAAMFGSSATKSSSPVQATTEPAAKPRPVSRGGLRGPGDVISLADSSKKNVEEQAPAPAGNVISLVDSSRSRSPTRKIHEQVAALAARGKQAGVEPEEPASQPSSPKKLDAKRMSKFLDDANHKLESGEPLRPLSPSKTGGNPRPLSPQKTGGRFQEADAPRPLSPQKTGGRALPEAPLRSLSPQKTGGRQLPEPAPVRTLSPQKTGGYQLPESDAPKPLSPQKTGGRTWPDPQTPRPLSPQKTGGRRLPEAPVSPSRQPQNEKPLSPVKSAAAVFEGSSSAAPALAPVLAPVASVSASEPQKPLMHSRAWSQNKITPRPLPIPARDGPTSPSPPSPVRSPTKYASEIATELNEFFGRSRPKRDYSVDAAELLMHRPAEAVKVKTHSVQFFRIGYDGKKQTVPAHQERILFEQEMYLCGHTFTDGSGRRTSEVYFWAGDEVPASAIDAAQSLVGREARAMGGRLIGFAQGKESPEFLQALGGIVVVRRGSSNKYDSLAPSMLCGRRFQGQITFDEVDFSSRSLCSGFPYLISRDGKCYLWKGKGSDVDELSCARLMGMDLALMGELVEVDDGQEPAEFWTLFGGDVRPGSADHWRLKPNYQKYCGRLFRSDAGDREQIAEICPFSQTDLDPAGIYILDCFFEMYIVVGYGAQPQYASFRNALDFAQEYAILASSMEDRPFVPISTVVLEGIPRDLKSVFRKWRDAASPTRMNAGGGPSSPGSPQQGLQRGRSLRVMPLNQALLALAD